MQNRSREPLLSPRFAHGSPPRPWPRRCCNVHSHCHVNVPSADMLTCRPVCPEPQEELDPLTGPGSCRSGAKRETSAHCICHTRRRQGRLHHGPDAHDDVYRGPVVTTNSIILFPRSTAAWSRAGTNPLTDHGELLCPLQPPRRVVPARVDKYEDQDQDQYQYQDQYQDQDQGDSCCRTPNRAGGLLALLSLAAALHCTCYGKSQGNSRQMSRVAVASRLHTHATSRRLARGIEFIEKL